MFDRNERMIVDTSARPQLCRAQFDVRHVPDATVTPDLEKREREDGFIGEFDPVDVEGTAGR